VPVDVIATVEAHASDRRTVTRYKHVGPDEYDVVVQMVSANRTSALGGRVLLCAAVATMIPLASLVTTRGGAARAPAWPTSQCFHHDQPVAQYSMSGHCGRLLDATARRLLAGRDDL
jgi:hypothetical protein